MGRRRSRRGFGRCSDVVMIMDANERKAAFAEARAEAYEKSLARHAVSARAEPAPVSQNRTPTDSEMLRWKNYIDGKISEALADYHESKSVRPITRELLRGLVT